MKFGLLAAVIAVFAIGVIAPTTAKADDAAKIWAKKCKKCHGEDGKGDTKTGKKMKIGDMTSADWQKKFDDAAMKKTIVEGFKREVEGVKQKMSAGKKFTPEEVDGLIKMIRAFAPAP